MVIPKTEFAKLEYLIGFVNNIAEIVGNPEEDLDFNTKDSSVYSIGYSLNSKDNIRMSCIDGDYSITAFKENLNAIENMIKDSVSVDHTKEWEKLRK